MRRLAVLLSLLAGCSCGDPCDDDPCHGHGACAAAGDEAVCACDLGYGGAGCEACQDGFLGFDGRCVPDCSRGVCGLGGACEGAGAAARCVCKADREGVLCERCVAGLQDNDGDGRCAVSCAAAALACRHGRCDDSVADARCACDEGWGGLSCDACAAGWQDKDLDGVCRRACSTAGLSCGSRAHCTDAGGTAVCACDSGYGGDGCSDCAALWQDHDGNGLCEPACGTAGLDCSGHGTCDDASGRVACACESGFYDDGRGRCAVPDGRSCPGALLLDLASGRVQGDTSGAGATARGSCQNRSSRDVAWRIDLPERLRLRLRAHGFDTVLHLRGACADPTSEIACNDDIGDGDEGSALDELVGPGSVWLFVDGAPGEAGPYTLDVAVTCPDAARLWDPAARACVPNPCLPNPCAEAGRTRCVPVLPGGHECRCPPGHLDTAEGCVRDPDADGTSCERALPLEGREGTDAGSTADTVDHGLGSCGGAGPDRVYAFTVEARARASFAMGGYDTLLHLRAQCATEELACNDDASGTAAGFSRVLEPGTYYLWADSYGAGGAYELSWSMRPDPCAGDPCPGAPECVPSADWTSWRCACPEGQVPSDSTCVDDPCLPNPCAPGAHRSRCVPVLPAGTASCTCDIGYLDDGAGGCALDPNANDWAVLVYLNGDNNLEEDAYDDIDEMMRVGSSPNVHVVVLLDSASRDNGDARLLYIRNGAVDVLQNLGELDMSDWHTLRDFGLWALQTWPARRHALVLWDHGDGWRSQAPGRPVVKGFSNDDSASGEISIANGEFGQALAAMTAALGDRLDLVAFDACLMGMWEVADATSPYARVLVASEETIPGLGFDYDTLLSPLLANPGWSAAQLGTAIADTYHAASDKDSTLSVIDLDRTAGLRAAMSAFGDALRAHPELYAQVDTARRQALGFDDPESRDLLGFAQAVRAISGCPADLAAAADALEAQLGLSVLHNRVQARYGGAHGLATYLPQRGGSLDGAYSSGTWSQATTWDEFLEDFTR